MDGRDPRKNPRRGDVLERDGHTLRVAGFEAGYVRCINGDDTRQVLDIGGWCRWARFARVVMAGSQPSR